MYKLNVNVASIKKKRYDISTSRKSRNFKGIAL